MDTTRACTLCRRHGRHRGGFERNCLTSTWCRSGLSRRSTHILVLASASLLLLHLALSCHENANLFHTISWVSSFFNILLGKKMSSGMTSSPQTEATVVTAYYPLSQGSKHSLYDYRAWMENVLPHVEAPVVIYLPADDELQATVRTMRGNLPFKIQTADLWDLPPVAPLQEAFKTWQHDIDPERWIHSPELYAIWNAKPWMLHEAAKTDVFNSKYFFWADIGAWRHRPYPTWPDQKRLTSVFSPSHERMLLSIVSSQGNGRHNVQGGFFGGTFHTVSWWTEAYYALLNRTVAERRFAGKDQNLMTELLYQHPQRFLVLQSDSAPFGDPWFFFEPFLAAPQDILPLLESQNGWKDNVSRNVSVIHNPRLVVVGEQIVTRERGT